MKSQRVRNCCWALIFILCLVAQECLWFWLGTPGSLSSSDAFSSIRIPVSTDLTGECSVAQKGNCQLCGHHHKEFNFILSGFVANEGFHNEKKNANPHSHHRNSPLIMKLNMWQRLYIISMLNSYKMPNSTEPALSEIFCKPEKSMSWVVSLLALISPSPEIV